MDSARRADPADQGGVDATAVEVGPADRVFAGAKSERAIDPRPVNVCAVDRDVQRAGSEEAGVDATAVEVGTADRALGDGTVVVRPVDVARGDRDAIGAADAGDEASIDARAVEVGPANRAVVCGP